MDLLVSLFQILRSEMAERPGMGLWDIVKFCYHQINGSAHMLFGRETGPELPFEIASGIRREMERGWSADRRALYTDMGNGILRLDLVAAYECGITPRALTDAVLYTVRQCNEDKELFRRYLEWLVAPMLSESDQAELKKYIQSGMPPVSHTQGYKNAYLPAYRLLSDRYRKALDVLAAVPNARHRDCTAFTLGIDGPCCGGKSTLASRIAELTGWPVVHADDYFLPPELRTPQRLAVPGENMHRERLLSEVLDPINRGERALMVRRFDCGTLELKPPKGVKVPTALIIEGSYCLHKDLRDMYDLAVFLDVDRELRRTRVLSRESADSAELFFSRWIPLEEDYFDAFRVKESADLVLE